jgi:hypothetical protein
LARNIGGQSARKGWPGLRHPRPSGSAGFLAQRSDNPRWTRFHARAGGASTRWNRREGATSATSDRAWRCCVCRGGGYLGVGIEPVPWPGKPEHELPGVLRHLRHDPRTICGRSGWPPCTVVSGIAVHLDRPPSRARQRSSLSPWGPSTRATRAGRSARRTSTSARSAAKAVLISVGRGCSTDRALRLRPTGASAAGWRVPPQQIRN